MNWQWFYKLGSPKWFYQKTNYWQHWLGAFAVMMLVVGAIWGLAFTPPDFKQGNSFRIIYVHVPASAVSLAGFYIMALAGAAGLIWRVKLQYTVMSVAAPIGAVLTFLSLVTGAIWGKPTWGTYWQWDARITFTTVQFFLYLGIIALQQAYRNQNTADKACAVLALVGTVNIPIIYKSVDWWYSLHQPATLKLTEKSSIAPEMAYPLIWMILAYYLCYVWLLISHTNAAILQRERKAGWVQALFSNSNSTKAA